MKKWIVLAVLFLAIINNNGADTGPEPEGDCDHDDYIYQQMVAPPTLMKGTPNIDTKCRGEEATITVSFLPMPGTALFVCPKTGATEPRDVPCTQVSPWTGHESIGEWDKTVQWGGVKEWGWTDPGGGWHHENTQVGDTFETEKCEAPDPDPDPDPNPDPDPSPDPGDDDPPSDDEQCDNPAQANVGATQLSHPEDETVYLKFPTYTNVVNVGEFVPIVQKIITINTPEERTLTGKMKLIQTGGNLACVQIKHDGQPCSPGVPINVIAGAHNGCGVHVHGHSEWFEFIPKQYGEVTFEAEVDPDPDVSGDGQQGNEKASFKVIVPKIEIKVTSANSPTGSTNKYNATPQEGSADNLYAVWPNEDFKIEVKIEPQTLANNLPPGFIQWVADQPIPDNTKEFTFNWSYTGTKCIFIQFPKLQMSKVVTVDVPEVGNIGQLSAAAQLPPQTVIEFFSYAQQATDYCNNQFPLGPKRDAIRHSFWNALCASDPTIPTSVILSLTTAHEYDNKWTDKQQAFNTTMDLWNNFIGYGVNHTILGFPNTPMILSDLFNKYDNGELRIWAGDCPQQNSEGILIKSNGEKIIPENY